MTQPRRYDAQASRAAILKAAAKLFIDHGFAATSMSELARAAGVTKSLIHHHFESKEALWMEVKHELIREFHERELDLMEHTPDPRDLLVESSKTYAGFLREHPEIVRLKCWLHLEKDEWCSDAREELMEIGIKQIKEGQAAGQIRNDVPAHFILISFLNLIEGWFMSCYTAAAALKIGEKWDENTQQSHFDSAYFSHSMKIFMDGIRPENQAKPDSPEESPNS